MVNITSGAQSHFQFLSYCCDILLFCFIFCFVNEEDLKLIEPFHVKVNDFAKFYVVSLL